MWPHFWTMKSTACQPSKLISQCKFIKIFEDKDIYGYLLWFVQKSVGHNIQSLQQILYVSNIIINAMRKLTTKICCIKKQILCGHDTFSLIQEAAFVKISA